MKLTDSIIKALPAPETGRRVITDTRLPGLHLRVGHKGGKHWSLVLYKDGRQKRHNIGRWPIVSAKMAFEKALEISRAAL